ncbi:MAG: PQQ-dependent sugar dehydrogenase [Pseudomonadota bacterium]
MAGARLGGAAQPALALAMSLVSASAQDPIYVLAAPGDTQRLFIVERAGRVRIVQNGALLATPFIDISARTSSDGERGLLSLAFHPQFAANGYLFLCFTDLDGNIALERMHAPSASANAVEYPHDAAGANACAIIGGYVYRGKAMPGLRGQYFYSDYCKAYLKSFTFSDGKAGTPVNWPIPAIGRVLSFGTDAQGELYMVATTGIYRVVPG